MRVLFAPGSYAGSLSAPQVAAAMAEGWSRGAPHDLLTTLPLGDGGAGFLDVVVAATGAQVFPLVAHGPRGRDVPASIAVTDVGGVRTAYVETVQVVGAHLLESHRMDAMRSTSRGVADLLLAALDVGAHRVVVGVGPSVALDGGAGILAALGAGSVADTELVAPLAGGLSATGLAAARRRWNDVELLLATDDDLPLLGFHGMAATRGPDLGLGDTDTQWLEGEMGRFVDHATAALGQRDLITGRPRRLDRAAGAGAGGGIGFALLLLGAQRVSASAEVSRLARLTDHLAAADLVVTGVGRFDWEEVGRGIVREVASAAGGIPVPAICVAAQSLVGRREAMSLGLAGTYALGERPDEIRAALADPVGSLERRMARLARTWSPAS